MFETLTPAQRSEVRAARDAQRARMREAVRERLGEPRDRPPNSLEGPGDEPPDVDGPDDLVEDPPSLPSEPGRGDSARPRAKRPAGMPEMLADLNVTPEQLRRLRQLRWQQAPKVRQTSFLFRDLQSQIDELLVADAIDSVKLRDLAVQLGRADAERELARFESEAGIREILTAEQAAAFRERRRRQWNEGRGADEPVPGPPQETPPRP